MQTPQRAAAKEPAWDFSPVYDLLQSLKPHDSSLSRGENKPPKQPPHAASAEAPANGSISEQLRSGLGNFNKLWDYLGVERDAPSPPSVAPLEAGTADPNRGHDAYTSDGALYYPPSSKAEFQGLDRWDLTDSPDADNDETPLTKNQRKKRNRKLRKAADAVNRQTGTKWASGVAQSDNEGAYKGAIPPHHPSKTNHSEPVDEKSKAASVSDDELFAVARKPATPKQAAKEKATANGNTSAPEPTILFKHSTPLKNTPQKPVTHATPSITEARNRVAAALNTPLKAEAARQTTAFAGPINESIKKQWHLNDSNAARLKPYPAQLAAHTRTSQPTQARPQPVDLHKFPVIQQQPQPRLRHEILPLANVSSVDRNWALLLKLLHNFPEDRKHLVSPLQLSINRPQPDGIHVFVDASNILIGFYEHLKEARGIPSNARVPRVDLNFHALALLLERRRPVAKRVLSGSTPEIQAFEEARQVGYETNILDKVWKAKELTDKQKRYRDREMLGAGSGYVSGSESAGNGVPKDPQKAKWVEQAVDEILHLKILESVVDTYIPADAVPPNHSIARTNGHSQPEHAMGATPPGAERPSVRPTMVLATGDAAEAEYSPGFRKMVERALKSGWMVEVMAFARSVSMDYRKMEKLPLAKGGWGERFRIIELDEYAEELFGEGL